MQKNKRMSSYIKNAVSKNETGLTGNNRLLLSILQSNIYCSIKIEGKKLQWGERKHYYEILQFTKGHLDFHICYTEDDLTEYYESDTTMILRLDNINTQLVINEFQKEVAAAGS